MVIQLASRSLGIAPPMTIAPTSSLKHIEKMLGARRPLTSEVRVGAWLGLGLRSGLALTLTRTRTRTLPLTLALALALALTLTSVLLPELRKWELHPNGEI